MLVSMNCKQIGIVPETPQQDDSVFSWPVRGLVLYVSFVGGLFLLRWLSWAWYNPCVFKKDSDACETERAVSQMQAQRDLIYQLAAQNATLKDYLPDHPSPVVPMPEIEQLLCKPRDFGYVIAVSHQHGISPCAHNWLDVQWRAGNESVTLSTTLHELHHVWFGEKGFYLFFCRSQACEEFITYARELDAIYAVSAFEQALDKENFPHVQDNIAEGMAEYYAQMNAFEKSFTREQLTHHLHSPLTQAFLDSQPWYNVEPVGDDIGWADR